MPQTVSKLKGKNVILGYSTHAQTVCRLPLPYSFHLRFLIFSDVAASTVPEVHVRVLKNK